MSPHVPSSMESLTTRLQSPKLVAKFQRYFGVELKHDEKVKENGTMSNGSSPPTVRYQRSNSLHNKHHSQHLKRENSRTLATHPHPHVIRNKFWYYLFSFGASLGYETFYASFFPMWFWNIDSSVGRRMVLLWVIIMYVGQALKDVIRWPRPASPPVVSLEPEYVIEYGMPSTHAMVGFALPCSMVIFTNNRYVYPLWMGIAAASSWCLLVCGSRLYLGMHSVLDILAGLLLASGLMAVLLPLVDAIDYWHLRSIYSPLITTIVILVISVFYPKRDTWSPARGDTSVITGAGAGILLGCWLNYQLGIVRGPELEPPFPIMWPGNDVAGLALLRAMIGVLLLLGSRLIGKLIGLNCLCYLRGLNASDAATLKRVSVEVPQKLITYVTLGMTITFLSPCVFRNLGIERVTMYTEV